MRCLYSGLFTCLISSTHNQSILGLIRFVKMTAREPNRCQRLAAVQGLEYRKNDIIYCPPALETTQISNSSSNQIPNSKSDQISAISNQPGPPMDQNPEVIVYFGGDIQDYRERMESHRDNRRYANDRNLEATAVALSKKFPSSPILVIKSNRLYLGSFACYANFLQCNDIGAPIQYPPVDHQAWEHLKLLLDRVGHLIQPPKDFSKSKLKLIGFSKGAVVLNQLVYELRSAIPESISDQIVDRVAAWYWLDGAHAGSKRTWITDVEVLDTLANRAVRNRVRIFAHVTPRQVRDQQRPWIGQEEAKFRHVLERHLGDLFTRQLHFENEPPSLENHFRVLDVFEPDRVK